MTESPWILLALTLPPSNVDHHGCGTLRDSRFSFGCGAARAVVEG
jgi:hypothetical protein